VGVKVKTKTFELPRPVVKWVGGKAFSEREIIAEMPEEFGAYHEPFFGGGAVFFALHRAGRIKRAVLSDCNGELMSMYRAIKTDPIGVMMDIKLLCPSTIDNDMYLHVRESKPTTETGRAARTLFLNKTCFNGLYRVNSSGGFNVPWNGKTKWVPDYANIEAVSKALQCAKLITSDFDIATLSVRGDVVYLDPPYFPVSKTANFTSYTSDGFTYADQLRVASVFAELVGNNVHAYASNSDIPVSRIIYENIPETRVIRLESPRRVNSDGKKRGLVGEILAMANGRKRNERAAQAAE
jgi:DNA adenine methylase